ncbi:unnamed protein product [Miscanthus lutarioriparius]|uniref:Uncharacterized protein n=1 Tax=Miscanthus lutarioriparius TaxID=422564 RepID=A0A811N815_9POAL|nr:unnamed protein product [Miscanthus lutarioriparius]
MIVCQQQLPAGVALRAQKDLFNFCFSFDSSLMSRCSVTLGQQKIQNTPAQLQSSHTVHSSALLPCSVSMHGMGSQRRLLLLLALLLLTLVAGEGDGALSAAGTDGANATDARSPAGAPLDVRARKWWRFPATEGLVGSERRVPNSSDPLHNR